jgi:hypothetical protein
MNFIMIGGKGRVGKTTLAHLIADHGFKNGLRPHIVSFANTIKREAEQVGLSKEEDPVKYRAFCQNAGVSHREADPDYFIKELHDVLIEYYSEEHALIESSSKYWDTLIIVDDCRFINEVAYGRCHNATQIFLLSGGRELIDATNEWRKDLSEDMANRINSGDKDYGELFPWMLLNDKTIEDLEEKIAPLLDHWCGLDAMCDEDCECDFCTLLKKDNGLTEVFEDLYKKILEMFGEDNEETEDSNT